MSSYFGAPSSKDIPIEQARPHKEYKGYKCGPHFVSYCACEYLNDNKKVLVFGKEQISEKPITHFIKETTWQERDQWYIDQFDITDPKTSNNLFGLFYDLYDVGTAHHEMYNGWIDCNWYEMSWRLQDLDFYLYGIAPAPYPMTWSDKDDDVAFVCRTYNDKSEFWCHGRKKWVENMRKQMKDIYQEMRSKYEN